MNNQWLKQSRKNETTYILSAREQALVSRGYSEDFIKRINAIHDDSLDKIAAEIFRYITRDCLPTQTPAAVLIGGQPGSGKSVLSRTLRKELEFENFVDVGLDNYRTWHPGYHQIEQEILSHWETLTPTDNASPGNDIADFTHRFSGDISDLLINMLSLPKNGLYYSICIDWGMRTPDQPLACLKLLKEKGYQTEVIFLCVPKDVSLDSCRYRADFMNSGEHLYRRIPDYFHTICVDMIPESCGVMYQKGFIEEKIIDKYSLRDRNNLILWCEKDDCSPKEICQRIIHHTHADQSKNQKEEARKTYYAESVGILKQEKWFSYLLNTQQQNYNVERVRLVERSHKNYTLNYVERTLRYIQTACAWLPEDYAAVLTRSLQWAEIAKVGEEYDRERWVLDGLDLSIHNLASAAIYEQETDDSDWIREVTSVLIKTHGMTGQFLRGETGNDIFQPILDLLEKGKVQADLFESVLYAQNRAVIKAASNTVWQKVKDSVQSILHTICHEKKLPKNLSSLERLHLIFPHAFSGVESLTETEQNMFDHIFSTAVLWYPQAALDTFTREEIGSIMIMIKEQLSSKITNISFEKLMKTLYYDYEGMRRINVYKKRIFEYYLHHIGDANTISHIRPVCEITGTTLYFDVKFTNVSERLIDFCVEAERSGLMEYQKNIITIFDLFGFRRDEFDRLNNEEKYLETMNDTAKSRKNEIIDYVTGSSVVDVGSGGGVLLDLLEKTYPERKIIGTDISTNVIETLLDKIQKEGHTYSVIRHNFVDNPLEEKVDNILFSSILHEVYSYTEVNGKRFLIDSVKKALSNAVASLSPNGRIIIRDGILSKEKEICSVKLLSNDGIVFAKNYLQDFRGLTHLRTETGEWIKEAATLTSDGYLNGNINLIREFLYTYTWGIESYSCEVNEQFGYFYLDEFTRYLESCGMKIIHAESYLEPGYPDNLNKLVELQPGLSWEEMPSSCLIVAEKSALIFD